MKLVNLHCMPSLELNSHLTPKGSTVEYGSAESNVLHLRNDCTFLFLCFSYLECAPGEAFLTQLSRFQPS